MLDHNLLRKEGYTQATIEAAERGDVELIGCEPREKAIGGLQTVRKDIDEYPTKERRKLEINWWIGFYQALGKYYYHTRIQILREWLAEEEE
jgi:hypothetical protein